MKKTRPWIIPAPADAHAVYRCCDDTGRLLYVGYSSVAEQRLAQHSKSASWWPEVEYIDITWHESRVEGLQVERELIWNKCPAYNLQRHRPVGIPATSQDRLGWGGIAEKWLMP